MRRGAHTLARAVEASGVGLHSGRTAKVRLRAGHAGEGITFVRTDLGGASLRAEPSSVLETRLSTALGSSSGSGAAAHARTVEHLLAALCGSGVSACVVELDTAELPLFDGSAAQWVSLIQTAGLARLPSGPAPLEPCAPVWASHGDSWVLAVPAESPQLTYGIDFGRFAPIGKQWFSWSAAGAALATGSASSEDLVAQLSSAGPAAESDARAAADAAGRACTDPFEVALAPARTFATTEGVAAARAAGLVLGGSLESALVCDEERWLGEGGLRFADEPVRHKTLDLLGDLALLGALPRAHVVAYKASHRLHIALARALADGTSGPAREEHYV